MNSSKMKTITLAVLALSGAIAFLHFSERSTSRSAAGIDRVNPGSPSASDNAANIREAYGKLPLAFEQNRGDGEGGTNFRARGAGYTLSLSATAASFLLSRGPNEAPPTVLQMNLVEANSGAAVEGLNELEGKVNYLIGNDPTKWRTSIATFRRVRYSEVYPGIDVVYYGNQRRLEYDFVVGPGRDPREIALAFTGAGRVEVEAGTGDLLIGVGEKTIRQHKPLVYQQTNGRRREIESRYAIRSDGRVGFEIGDYDRSATLVIDPVLVYSTFLGGSDTDVGNDIAVDSAGNAYVTGLTSSPDFPTANALQGAPNPVESRDCFITKINPAGSAIIYSTYLGGNNVDVANSIAVDSAGNAYITGQTASTDFPTANALQAAPAGLTDAFVAKLNSTGSALVYSTYLGGSEDDVGKGIALDSSGNPYVTGSTYSTNFPTANAIQSTYGGEMGFGFRGDAFVTKINNAGSALVYSTYLGGNRGDVGYGIAVDSTGAAYVAGDTQSANFPTVNAFQGTPAGAVSVFVTKLNPAGSALVYSTYLGGATDAGAENHTQPNGLAVDAAGSAHVVGRTGAGDFPTANALQNTRRGEQDAFVTKFTPAGSALVYSTYLGGNNSDSASAIAVDAAGNAHITGSTISNDFPIANAFQSAIGGFIDVFVMKLSPVGALIYSTYLGGSGGDDGLGLAVDAAGDTYVTGRTNLLPQAGPPRCFPITTGAFDTTFNGSLNTDGFVTKISETGPPAALVPCLSKLLNIGTRMRVLTGDSAVISGFIITGNDPKRVIIRGIGPSLTGIPGTLANPVLELFDSNHVLLGSNDDWKANQAEVEATTIPPSHDLESAIVVTLAPGAYTTVLRGKNNGTGIGVVEVYDLNSAADSELANISSRGFVDLGDKVMIGGFIVGGSGTADARVVVRGLGPSLSAFGVSGPLPDPIIDLKNANGTTLMSNDDWQQGQPTEINSLGLTPSDSRESALVAALPHGNYTAILRGKGNTTGIGVVEIYNVP